MPKLAPNTVTLLDGEVRLFKRPRSRAWQAAFKIGGRWKRVSTHCKTLREAKEQARELYYDYKTRHKNNLPIISKRFADVAAVAVANMDKQINAGTGKASFRDYKIVIEKYLVPYFGDKFITSIGYAELQAFSQWRAQKLGRAPKASTLNTHNSALNRVFDEAVAHGYINRTHVPALVNKGRDSVRRPDFRREEYRKMIARLPTWINEGRVGKSRDMRHLLRDYVLILANTGIRHGTEAANLRWKHIHLFQERGKTYLEMHVNGKNGPRDLMARAGTINYLKRIQSRCPDIAHLTFEDLLKKQVDEPVFRLPDGTVSMNLRQTFKILMNDTGLLNCPRTGQDRTLYSLRHTYATFALLNDGMDIHTLAIQMGTSIQMLEKHYSHLTPRLRKDMLTGKRYDLTDAEYRKQFDVSALAVTQADIQSAPPATDAADDELPEDPVDDDGHDAQDGQSGTDAGTDTEQQGSRSIADKALDLFEAGKLSEEGLLAAPGVSHGGYVPDKGVSYRVLDAVNHGKLSEGALIRILG